MSALGSLDQHCAIADWITDSTESHSTGELVEDLLTAIRINPGQYVAQRGDLPGTQSFWKFPITNTTRQRF